MNKVMCIDLMQRLEYVPISEKKTPIYFPAKLFYKYLKLKYLFK
jgi:hypothetical protein